MRAKFLALICLGAAALQAASPNSYLLVLEKAQNNLVLVDPASLQVVARVPVGKDPHEVVASEDGKVAYISNYERGRGQRFHASILWRRKHCRPSIWVP